MDNLKTDFTSNDNKALLWSILYEQGSFNNIQNNELQNIKTLFENKINNMHSVSNESLTNINKKLIMDMMHTLKNYTQKSSYTTNELVRVEDIQQERKGNFDKSLKDKENEMKSMLVGNKPNEVDFSDKADIPFDNNSMDMLLENMIKNRENELNQVIIKNKPEHTINIGENTDLLNNDITKISEKKVSFNDDIQEDEFINKLKKNPYNDINQPMKSSFANKNKNNYEFDELKILLREILDKQSHILDILNKKDTKTDIKIENDTQQNNNEENDAQKNNNEENDAQKNNNEENDDILNFTSKLKSKK